MKNNRKFNLRKKKCTIGKIAILKDFVLLPFVCEEISSSVRVMLLVRLLRKNSLAILCERVICRVGVHGAIDADETFPVVVCGHADLFCLLRVCLLGLLVIFQPCLSKRNETKIGRSNLMWTRNVVIYLTNFDKNDDSNAICTFKRLVLEPLFDHLSLSESLAG